MAHPVIAPRRQARKERLLSFRPTGEIFLRSLVAKVTGLGPSPWRPLLLCASPSLFGSLDPKFGQKIFNTFRSFLSLGFSQSVETFDYNVMRSRAPAAREPFRSGSESAGFQALRG